MKKKGLQTLCW